MHGIMHSSIPRALMYALMHLPICAYTYEFNCVLSIAFTCEFLHALVCAFASAFAVAAVVILYHSQCV